MDLTGISREDMDFTVKRCDCTTNVMLPGGSVILGGKVKSDFTSH